MPVFLWSVLRRLPELVLIAALMTSCGLINDYSQCSQDNDCPPLSGEKQQFCTSDHLCVDSTPIERLCPEKYPADASPDSVPIGTLLYLSNPLLKTTLRLQAIKLGIDDVNSYHGAGLRKLVLHICDTGYQQTEAGQSVDTHKALDILWNERKVVAVIGPMRSSEMIAVAAEVGAHQVPLVSPSAGATAISDLPQAGFLFRTFPSSAEEARLLAGQIPRGRTLALMWVLDSLGRDFHTAFVNAWIDPSSKVSASESWLPGNIDDLSRKTKFVMNNKPTVVVAVPTVDTKAWVAELAKSNSETDVYLSSGSRLTALLEVVGQVPGSYVSRIHGVAPVAPKDLPELADFRSYFASRFDQADPTTDIFCPYTYDAFYAIATAIESLTEEPTGAAVARALQRIAPGGIGIPVGPSFFLQAVRQLHTGSLTLKGTTGTLGFDGHGDRTGLAYELWKIDSSTMPPQFTCSPL